MAVRIYNVSDEAILQFLIEDDEETVKDLLGDGPFHDWEVRPGERDVLYDEYRRPMASSRNLRGLRQWVSQYPVAEIEIRQMEGPSGFKEGGLRAGFSNGWHCITKWSDYSTLKWTLRNWRNLYGVSLTVDGQPAGKVGFRNPALWVKDYGREPRRAVNAYGVPLDPPVWEAMEDEELGGLGDLLTNYGIAPDLEGDKVWKQVGENRWTFQMNAHQRLELIKYANYGDNWMARIMFDKMELSKFTGTEDEMIAKLTDYGYMPGGGLHTRELRAGGLGEALDDDDIKDLANPEPEEELTLDAIKALEPGFFDRKQSKFFGTKKIYKYPGNHIVVLNAKPHHVGFGQQTFQTDFVIYKLTRTEESPRGILLYKGRARDLQDAKQMIKTGDFRDLIDRYRHLGEAIDDADLQDVVHGPKISSINIVGRNWWRRGYGGNYYRADIYVNDEMVTTLPEQGGSEKQYLWDAFNWLEDNGYIQRIRREGKFGGSVEGPQQVADRMGFKLTYEAYTVRRERDL